MLYVGKMESECWTNEPSTGHFKSFLIFGFTLFLNCVIATTINVKQVIQIEDHMQGPTLDTKMLGHQFKELRDYVRG